MAITAQTNTNTLSLEAFLDLPETKPASEYIGDQIHQKPIPQGKHSTLQAETIVAINQIASPKSLLMLSLSCVVPLVGGQLCQIFQYLSGRIFPLMMMANR